MFYQLSNSVGSGKTQAILEYVRDNSDCCYLYVAPTIELCQEIHNRLSLVLVNQQNLIRRGLIEIVTSDPNLGNVYPRAEQKIQFIVKQGCGVVIITENTFRKMLSTLPDKVKSKLTVFIDEGLPPIRSVKFSPNKHEGFLQYFDQDKIGFITAKREHRETIGLVANNSGQLDKKQLGHLKIKEFMEICELVASGNYDVFLKTTDESIMVVGILSPVQMKAFENVVLIVAIFEQTLLPILWQKKYKIEFKKFKLKTELYDTHTEKGPLIEIFYLLHKDQTASKHNLNRNFETGEPNERIETRKVIYSAAQTISEVFPEGVYCWAANNDFQNTNQVLNNDRMPTISAGIDRYRHQNTVVSLVCINPQPWVKSIIVEIFQLQDDQLYDLWKLSYTYQTIGRCSIRNRDNDVKINLIVISSRCAEQLNKLFVGSKIIGQLTNLPNYNNIRQENRFIYTASDNSAYSKYRKREFEKGIEPLGKGTWYQQERINNKQH